MVSASDAVLLSRRVNLRPEVDIEKPRHFTDFQPAKSRERKEGKVTNIEESSLIKNRSKTPRKGGKG